MATQKRKSVEVDEIGAAGAGAPTMCATGCGFFGNPATGDLCSKCHREHAAAAATPTAAAVATTDEEDQMRGVFDTSVYAPPEKKARTIVCAVAVAPASPDVGGGADAFAVVAPVPPAAAEQQKPAANRCTACRKKVGLLGFRCCCGETFCGAHRYAEKHACTFDYKSAARERIAKNNPVVVADKIAKI